MTGSYVGQFICWIFPGNRFLVRTVNRFLGRTVNRFLARTVFMYDSSNRFLGQLICLTCS